MASVAQRESRVERPLLEVIDGGAGASVALEIVAGNEMQILMLVGDEIASRNGHDMHGFRRDDDRPSTCARSYCRSCGRSVLVDIFPLDGGEEISGSASRQRCEYEGRL